MGRTVSQWGRGALAALASLAVFAVSIACFIALMLLVISMEEGGDNLSEYTMPLAEAVTLLAQGSGFLIEPVELTLTPLLLTVLLVALVRAFARRLSCTMAGYLPGLAVWLGADAVLHHATAVHMNDPLWLILLRCAIVFTVGYLWAVVPESTFVAKAAAAAGRALGGSAVRAIRVGVRLVGVLLAVYAIMGVVAVIVWTATGYEAVARLYALIGMGMGSRILTTVACLAWLPNLCVWAVSWLFGAGFSIGDIAEFTLWSGQASGLPGIPVFGVLPQPVADERIRMVLLVLPLVCGLVTGSVAMWHSRGFAVRIAAPGAVDTPRLVESLAYPAGAFCIVAAVLSLVSSLVFLLSNGGLGKERLAHLGVDVIRSTQSVARPTAVGLFAAWLIAVVGVAAVFGIRWVSGRIRSTSSAGGTAAPHTARTVTGTPDSGHEPAAATKEEQDDEHEPTDTTGPGIRLP